MKKLLLTLSILLLAASYVSAADTITGTFFEAQQKKIDAQTSKIVNKEKQIQAQQKATLELRQKQEAERKAQLEAQQKAQQELIDKKKQQLQDTKDSLKKEKEAIKGLFSFK